MQHVTTIWLLNLLTLQAAAINICTANDIALSTKQLMTLLLVQAWGQHLQSNFQCPRSMQLVMYLPLQALALFPVAKYLQITSTVGNMCWFREQPAPAQCSSTITAAHSMNTDKLQHSQETGSLVTKATCAEYASEGSMQDVEVPESGTFTWYTGC